MLSINRLDHHMVWTTAIIYIWWVSIVNVACLPMTIEACMALGAIIPLLLFIVC